MGTQHDFEAKMRARAAELAASDDPAARLLAGLAPLVEAYQAWSNDVPDGTPGHDLMGAQVSFLSNVIGFTICFHALNARLPVGRVAVELGHQVNAATLNYVRAWSSDEIDSRISRRDGRDFDFRDMLAKDRP